MAELKLTPFRRELLAEVGSGKVEHHPSALGYEAYDLWHRDDGPRRKVTAAMEQLRSAGWVTYRRMNRLYMPSMWELTEAGRRVLDEHLDEVPR